MIPWLQQIPAERLLLWVFCAGIAWQQLAQARRSLRDHGKRLGRLASRLTRCETELHIAPPNPSEEGNGE